jgi:D-glycero-alpha-D-manno-heptose-7-phosphate kinase
MMFYTGITRKADDILIDQKSNINDRIEIISSMRDLALLGKTYLEQGEFDEFGKILNRNWELKKQLSDKINNPVVDDLCTTAMKAGVIGLKLCGAGFGGFLLLYVRKDKQDNVRIALHGLKELPFKLYNVGSSVIYNKNE